MVWPFNRIWTTQPTRGTIEVIYGMIVAQAREPAFYHSFGVPDTVNGRFDLLILHLWAVLRQLRSSPGGEQASQSLFDHFCADMDGNLREMGVGDLTVPKRMQAFGEAFYGRSAAYDMALSTGEAELAAALNRNILNGSGLENAKYLAKYVGALVEGLQPLDRTEILACNWRFPDPNSALPGAPNPDG